MVRFAAWIAFASLSVWAESPLSFKTECSKPQIYRGERVTCQFVVYSSDDRIEIEVAKFPEFRGFWSENTALRQGPMLLIPDSRQPGMRKAVIGSYHLIPMLGDAAPTITSMRLLLKGFRYQGEASETLLNSDPPALTILPLPPPPKELKPFFNGAVGHLTLRAEAPGLRFYPKEPTAIRFFLSGNGNFPEINTLPIEWPEGVQIVSQQSQTMGSGVFQTKTFQVVVTIDSQTSFDLPPLRLAYFNPALKQFQVTTSEPIHFEATLRPPQPERPEDINVGPAETEWEPSIPLAQTHSFWFLQVFLVALWLGFFARVVARGIGKLRNHSPWPALKARWKHLLSPKNEDAEWLKEADQLVFDCVRAHSQKPLVTRRDAVIFLRRIWGEKEAESAREIFTRWENSRFSPQPPALPARSEWTLRLRELRRWLLRRRPRKSRS